MAEWEEGGRRNLVGTEGKGKQGSPPPTVQIQRRRTRQQKEREVLEERAAGEERGKLGSSPPTVQIQRRRTRQRKKRGAVEHEKTGQRKNWKSYMTQRRWRINISGQYSPQSRGILPDIINGKQWINGTWRKCIIHLKRKL